MKNNNKTNKSLMSKRSFDERNVQAQVAEIRRAKQIRKIQQRNKNAELNAQRGKGNGYDYVEQVSEFVFNPGIKLSKEFLILLLVMQMTSVVSAQDVHVSQAHPGVHHNDAEITSMPQRSSHYSPLTVDVWREASYSTSPIDADNQYEHHLKPKSNEDIKKKPMQDNSGNDFLEDKFFKKLTKCIARRDLRECRMDLSIATAKWDSQRAEKLFDFLYENNDLIPKFLAAYHTRYPRASLDAFEVMERRTLAGVLKYQFNKKLSSALQNTDFNEVDKLLTFREMNTVFLENGEHHIIYKCDYSQFDWKNIEPTLPLCALAEAGLLRHIQDGDEGAAHWLLTHLQYVSQPITPTYATQISTQTKALTDLFWKTYIGMPSEKRNAAILDIFLNGKDAPPPQHSDIINLIQKNDIHLLKQICIQWPHLCNTALISDALNLSGNELAKSLLPYVMDINEKYLLKNNVQITAPKQSQIQKQNARVFNDITGKTLLHECALKNNLDFAKILLAHGAKPDLVQTNGMTPLALALAQQHFDFAWMLVDIYQEQGIEITESNAFGILDYINKTYQRAAQGNVRGAAKLLFFCTTKNSQSQAISALIIASILTIYILARCLYTNIQDKKEETHKRQDFFDKAIRFLNTIPKLSDALIEYIDSIDKLGVESIDIVSHELVFPLAIIRSDGQTYKIDKDDKSLEEAFSHNSYTSHEPFVREDFRININLISYLRLIIKGHIEDDEKILPEQKKTFMNELDELAKKLELLDDLEACVCDPVTKKRMEKPSVAPNGRSYDVAYDGNKTHFDEKISDMGLVNMYRNYTLQNIIETLSLKPVATARMS